MRSPGVVCSGQFLRAAYFRPGRAARRRPLQAAGIPVTKSTVITKTIADYTCVLFLVKLAIQTHRGARGSVPRTVAAVRRLATVLPRQRLNLGRRFGENLVLRTVRWSGGPYTHGGYCEGIFKGVSPQINQLSHLSYVTVSPRHDYSPRPHPPFRW